MDVEGRTSNANDNSLTHNPEHGQEKDIPNDSYDLSTAHTIDRDSWQQVGLMLVTGFNCGWIFSFSNLIMVPLGWTWGVILLFVVGLYTAYANWLLAAFHFIDGRRFIRYRDLMGFVYDGKSNTNKDFNITGSKVNKVFNSFGAISAIIVTNTSGMLPEIQSTLRKPAVKNMRKALFSQYTVGALFYYGVTIIGYWAYGSMVSSYLPENLSGPRWINVIVNVIVFLQSIVSQHMFVVPIHEALDTRFLEIGKGMHSGKNFKRLFLLRVCFYTGNTLVAAAFPFMGDFVNLLGSFSLVPLTFMFPSMLFLKIKGKGARIEKKAWHWINILFSFLLTIATTISAIRFIIDNIQKYQFFADA